VKSIFSFNLMAITNNHLIFCKTIFFIKCLRILHELLLIGYVNIYNVAAVKIFEVMADSILVEIIHRNTS
jgi:hypothetical protein